MVNRSGNDRHKPVKKSLHKKLNKTKFLHVPKPAREEKRKLTRQNDETPDFSGVSDFSGPYRIVVLVEMAGLEPASRTLLNKATTLISGALSFANRLHRRQRSVHYPECVFIRPFRQKQMKLTCANRSSSAGYAILRFQSKRLRRRTMAD